MKKYQSPLVATGGLVAWGESPRPSRSLFQTNFTSIMLCYLEMSKNKFGGSHRCYQQQSQAEPSHNESSGRTLLTRHYRKQVNHQIVLLWRMHSKVSKLDYLPSEST